MQNPMTWILYLWLAFTLTHIVGSHPPIRKRLISGLSLKGFKLVYSIVAIATFGPLVWVYSQAKHAGELLFLVPLWMEALNHGMMFLAVFVLVQGFATPNPLTTVAELAHWDIPSPQGVQRWTRHPVNFAFFLFGLAHILTNPFEGDILFFGGIILFSVFTAWHQDYRMRRSGDDKTQEFLRQTSLVPFWAILRREQKWGWGEIKPWTMAASILLFILLRALHPFIFGGFR